jgi:hypothetical protein
MTRAQYYALCLIGGVALVAYLETLRIGAALSRISAPARSNKASGTI